MLICSKMSSNRIKWVSCGTHSVGMHILRNWPWMSGFFISIQDGWLLYPTLWQFRRLVITWKIYKSETEVLCLVWYFRPADHGKECNEDTINMHYTITTRTTKSKIVTILVKISILILNTYFIVGSGAQPYLLF